MPVGIDGLPLAGSVDLGQVGRAQRPPHGAEVLPELFLVARPDDHGGDGRALQHPVEGDLGDGLADLAGDFLEDVDETTKSIWLARLPGGGAWLRRTFPVSDPPAIGLQTWAPTFWSRPRGMSSHS